MAALDRAACTRLARLLADHALEDDVAGERHVVCAKSLDREQEGRGRRLEVGRSAPDHVAAIAARFIGVARPLLQPPVLADVDVPVERDARPAADPPPGADDVRPSRQRIPTIDR
ncbi:MAG: hypothetical protein OXG37_03270 [Actinomycetia bacterium]|nr:hypothetical protein [Actinomycetes bacterium]